MKKMTQFITLILAIMCVVGCFPVSAEAYATYTYDIDGFVAASPDAYTPDQVINYAYMGLKADLNDVRDMFVDKNNNVYLANAKANEIVVLDPYFKHKFSITEFVNHQGVPDSLNTPSGVFVTEDRIYVADTENNRIVIFDLEGEFIDIFEEPDSDVMPENSIYKPVALAVDSSGRVYVVSSTTYMGVISLNNDGTFAGFIGAQKVTYDILDIIWRRFQTEEQRAQTVQYVSTEFNNITIDDDGFVYVTTSSIEESAQQAAITSKAADYAPVKKLNTAGTDIMRRNGFFAPGGEVRVDNRATAEITGASKIIDVALGPEGTWSIIDEKRNKVYTYDADGKLLFIFGDKGMQKGNLQSVEAIAYQGEKLLLLDKTANTITTYNRTEYGDILINALRNNNNRRYDLAVEDWEAILQRNNNFDAAYIGIGKALYRAGDWEGAMSYYKFAYDTENYSNAFKMWRKDWVSKYIIVVPIFIIVVVVLVGMFFKYAGKVNKKVAVTRGKRTFAQELLYAFHLIFHPFDGYWDLKHERRGSLRAALFYLAITIAAFAYQAIGRAYIFNPYGSYSSIFVQCTSLLVPVMLWVTANWCLTTLFDGEGSFKDIFIATCYALVPLPLLIIPSVLITHVVTLSEAGIVNLIVSFAWIWTGLLVFFGVMVTHDYTLGKNILTCLGTIVGMCLIMFIALLFSSLVAKMTSFIYNIGIEISYRL
ncbi:MAG: YIP1 family protein [Clostridia bacterium]|nr:YIP1 family protein [Clostridia bacterium]